MEDFDLDDFDGVFADIHDVAIDGVLDMYELYDAGLISKEDFDDRHESFIAIEDETDLYM